MSGCNKAIERTHSFWSCVRFSVAGGSGLHPAAQAGIRGKVLSFSGMMCYNDYKIVWPFCGYMLLFYTEALVMK